MENLIFKIVLDSDYHPDIHDTAADCKIRLNGVEIDNVLVQEETVVEFSADVGNLNTLDLIMTNKTKHDVLIENDKIVKDKILHINEIYIDEVNVTSLASKTGELYPTDEWYIAKNRDTFPIPILNCMNTGFNCRWTFKFESPFYIWILENL